MRALRDELAAAEARARTGPGSSELMPRIEPVAERARELLARPAKPPRSAPVGRRRRESPLRSVYTQSFPQMLEQLGSSLLVSTYQTGKLICARHDRGTLNTHFRDFQRPMGLAVAPGGSRSAPGPRSSTTANVPAVAPKVEPRGKPRRLLPAPQPALHRRHPHPRDRLRPGRAVDRRHQLLLPGDARRRAQLRPALDAARSSRASAPEDRCHLNGLCVIDDEPRYVTALGETDDARRLAREQGRAAGS